MKKIRRSSWYNPIEALPKYDFIHPWMPRELQKLRQRVADALGINYYDTERLFTDNKERP